MILIVLLACALVVLLVLGICCLSVPSERR